MGSSSKTSSWSSPAAVLLATVCLALIVPNSHVTSAAVPHKRSVAAQGDQANVVEPCRSYSICGWEVYEPYSRNSEYYVAGQCKCPSELACIRTDDDLANSAYVYRCRVLPNRKNRNRNKSTTRPNSAVAVSP